MAEEKSPPAATWMSDVQRVLALILISSFAIVTLYASFCSIFWPEAYAADMAKTLQQALVNMCLIGLGFFFGSSTSSVKKDDAMIASAIAAAPARSGTGASPAAITAAAEAAAPAAAEAAAPAAAAEAAPAAAEAAAPPAADVAVPPVVEAELDRRGIPDKTKE